MAFWSKRLNVYLKNVYFSIFFPAEKRFLILKKDFIL